jgi:hypothetical protein
MRRRKTTKEMNKHQSPRRSEDLSGEKDKQRIQLISKSQKRRHLLSGVFYGVHSLVCPSRAAVQGWKPQRCLFEAPLAHRHRRKK